MLAITAPIIVITEPEKMAVVNSVDAVSGSMIPMSPKILVNTVMAWVMKFGDFIIALNEKVPAWMFFQTFAPIVNPAGMSIWKINSMSFAIMATEVCSGSSVVVMPVAASPIKMRTITLVKKFVLSSLDFFIETFLSPSKAFFLQ